MKIAIPVDIGLPACFKVPKQGETAPFARQLVSSFNERQAVFEQNPSLQFDQANTFEESIGMMLTNTAQLANKAGRPDELAAILKTFRIAPPSDEQLQSRDGIEKIQQQVQSKLNEMSRSDKDRISEAISIKFDELVHEVANRKGALINTSA